MFQAVGRSHKLRSQAGVFRHGKLNQKKISDKVEYKPHCAHSLSLRSSGNSSALRYR